MGRLRRPIAPDAERAPIDSVSQSMHGQAHQSGSSRRANPRAPHPGRWLKTSEEVLLAELLEKRFYRCRRHFGKGLKGELRTKAKAPSWWTTVRLASQKEAKMKNILLMKEVACPCNSRY